MDNVLIYLTVVKWFANDLHYTWSGNTFYGMHLLADKISDFGSAVDDINENYYMGFVNINPPKDIDITSRAIESYKQIYDSNDGNQLKCVCAALSCLLGVVQLAKTEDGLVAGVHAILDSISEKALKYRGLANRALEVK